MSLRETHKRLKGEIHDVYLLKCLFCKAMMIDKVNKKCIILLVMKVFLRKGKSIQESDKDSIEF
jgi:hypothetical protein